MVKMTTNNASSGGSQYYYGYSTRMAIVALVVVIIMIARTVFFGPRGMAPIYLDMFISPELELDEKDGMSAVGAGADNNNYNNDDDDNERGFPVGGDREEEEETSSATTTITVDSKYYDVSQIVKLSTPLAKVPQTIVTAYFQIKSKHSSDSYNAWIQNMLSLKDPMVIFLSPALIPQVTALRQHALDRTVIVPMEVRDVPLAVNYNTSFWEHQLQIDPEKQIHKGYQVFWIWLSKSWWVNEAIRHNFFDSDVFVWSDMGCFRNQQYNGKEIVLHPETIPRHSMMFLAHHPTNPPPDRIWNNKYDKTTKKHFYHSGSMAVGYKDTFQLFHQHFLLTIAEFLKRDMFIGEDQTVLQSTCMSYPSTCAYVPNYEVKDNFYFGLRYVLHHGGNYTLWYPPALGVTDY